MDRSDATGRDADDDVGEIGLAIEQVAPRHLENNALCDGTFDEQCMERWRQDRSKIPAETIRLLCLKLKELQQKSETRERLRSAGAIRSAGTATGLEAKECAMCASLCTALASAALDNDVRRCVRNEGGLKTLVLLVGGSVDEGVIAAVSHALTNLSIDPISKVEIALKITSSSFSQNVLRACGWIAKNVDLLSASENRTAQKSLLGCLINMMANSLINSIAMIDHDLMAKLKEILVQGKQEKAIEARAHLLLAQLQFFRTPASRSEDASTCLYDHLKQQATDDPALLSIAFDQWMASREIDDIKTPPVSPPSTAA